MNKADYYAPLELPRRWIRQRAATSSFYSSTAAVRYTGKSFRSLLSRITPAKTSKAISCHADEAETPFIFWVDEKFPNSVKKKETFVDPFEAKEYQRRSFQIIGTIRCIATLDAIVENEQQEQDSLDPAETKASVAGQQQRFEVSSPTSSIKIVGCFDCTSLHLVPVRLFPGEHENADNSDVFNESGCRYEEDGFETVSFECVNFEDDNIDVSGAATSMNELNISGDESLEVWIDSEDMMNGFTKATDFRSHDWDDETD